MTKHYPQFVHSAYTKSRYGDDAVIIKERILKDDGTSEPHLRILKNPKRKFWVTKPTRRNHEFKKEYEDKSNLDEYICENREMERVIDKALQGWSGNYVPPLKKLCDSPFVYGANIPIEVLVKLKYMQLCDQAKQEHIPFTQGFLDIETSVLSGNNGMINLITVTHENKIYTAILDSFLYKTIKTKEHGVIKQKATMEDVEQTVHTALAKYTKEYGFEYNFFIGKTEEELIRWIFEKIHENKTDFVGIWNLDFDIPKIIEALRNRNIPLEDVLCSPEVPKEFRKVYYKQDTRSMDKLAHFTEKWHWLTATAHTQFIDNMNLYSRLRKVKGYEPSYTLQAILEKELKLGKLPLGDEGSHYVMQTERFLDYIAYNIFDAIALELLRRKNDDITTMSILAGHSLFSQFAYQTVMVTNDLYEYCERYDKVPAATGFKMRTRFTDEFGKKGGTVLPPERNTQIGVHALADRPDFETQLSAFVFDVDFSAYYPRTQMGCNISTETKLSSALQIQGHNGEAVHDYFSNIIAPRENAVYLGHQYYGLPNYEEMEAEILEAGI